MEEKKTFSNHIAKKQPKYSIKPILSYYPKPEARASGFAVLIIDLPQRFTHRCTRVCFRHSIKVAIDIRRGAHIAMSEPFLDLLHRYALGEEHRGAGVAQIVEADFLQIMLFQKLPEVSGDEVGCRIR